MGDTAKGKSSGSRKVIAVNKKARHLYKIEERFEAGIELLGHEVKSIRSHLVSYRDSYVSFEGKEAYLSNLHIGHYKFARIDEGDTDRPRRLLLKKREIKRLTAKVDEKGWTLVPLCIYIRGKWIKVEIGLGRGKKLHDKRETIAKRDAERDMERAFKESHQN